MMKKKETEFILTDDCAFMEKPPKGYSTDPKRSPHGIFVVDLKTGTRRLLQSGSVIRIVKEVKHW